MPVALAISYATLDTSRCGISAVRTSSSASSLSIPRASARFSRNRVLGRDQWPRSRFAIELGEQPASEARSAWVSRCVRRWNSQLCHEILLGKFSRQSFVATCGDLQIPLRSTNNPGRFPGILWLSRALLPRSADRSARRRAVLGRARRRTAPATTPGRVAAHSR